MRMRKITICALALSLLSGSVVTANEVVQTWKGKKVQVTVNGQAVPGGGIVIDGITYIPVNDQTMSAMIRTDSNSLQIYRPNVHITLLTTDKLMPFSSVIQGNWNFMVLAQIDNLKTKVHSLKVEIVDPDGKTVEQQELQITQEKEAFWFTSSAIQMQFEKVGPYKVKFYMKQSPTGAYELLSEKIIDAKAKE